MTSTKKVPGVISGVLVVDKASGPTSHDIVQMARRALGERRVGHCGTLDPMATGVLVLAVGVATRLAPYLTSDEKQYDAAVRFGVVTDTYDVTGEVQRESADRPTAEAIEAALARFRGAFAQRPPPFSAKKVRGERAYAMARRQVPVELAPVAVEVRALTLASFDGTTARLSMTVSAGFYVRSLAYDLGMALGMGAALEGLRRTASGAFTLANAVGSHALMTGARDDLLARLIPLADLLPDRPALRLTEADVAAVGHGRDLVGGDPTLWTALSGDGGALVRLLAPDGGLVALAVPGKVRGVLHPSVVLR